MCSNITERRSGPEVGLEEWDDWCRSIGRHGDALPRSPCRELLIVVAAYREPPGPRSYPTEGAPCPVMLGEI